MSDDTLSMAGYNLDGAALVVWAEGVLREITPLRTHSDRMQAVIPKDFPASAMLVWPVKDGIAGLPLRMNAAEAWWVWPCRVRAAKAGETVRVIGKNLVLPGRQPLLYVEGEGVATTLPVKTAAPYHLEADLPPDLPPGSYTVRAHNGTGGVYGWSEALAFEVKTYPEAGAQEVYRVDDFGAVPNGPARDSLDAIQRACDKASRAGGGTVLFAAGTYLLSGPVRVPANVTFAGAGMGAQDPETTELSGTFTVLRPLDAADFPEAITIIEGDNATIRNMTLANSSTGNKQHTLMVLAHDVTIENTRVILSDARDWSDTFSGTQEIIDTAAIYINKGGDANIVIRDCEAQAPGGIIVIGDVVPGHNSTDRCPPSTDRVRISGVRIRGYHAGSPNGVKRASYENALSAGVAVYNGKKLIVENCDFAGADRYNGKVLNRTITCVNTSVRHCYFAHNRSMDVGDHPSMFTRGALATDAPARNSAKNQGEQYIFHYHYPQGGLFDVVASTPTSTTVSTAGFSPEASTKLGFRVSWNADGSRVIDEVGENRHWLLYVGRGKGAGQYREIGSKTVNGTEVEFALARPWRVVPDRSSRVVLTVAYRNNIMYRNVLDSGVFVPEIKVHLVAFWYNALDNIIAENSVRNCTSGVVYNSSYRNPTAWNLTIGNTAEHVYGASYDTSERAAGYVDHYRAYGSTFPKQDRDVLWYEVGNVCRGNTFRDCEVGAFVHTRNVATIAGLAGVSHEDGGIMMCVVEKNRFENNREGIRLGAPANWAVIRDNVFAGGQAEKLRYIPEAEEAITEPLVIEQGETARLTDLTGLPLLLNGGFDDIDPYGNVPFYWPAFHATDSDAEVHAEQDVATGNRYVTVRKTNAVNYSGVMYTGPAVKLREGVTYRLSGRARSAPGQRYQAVILMYGADNAYLGAHTASAPLQTADWERFESRFTVKPGTVRFRLELRAQGNAYGISYDDLALEAVP